MVLLVLYREIINSLFQSIQYTVYAFLVCVMYRLFICFKLPGMDLITGIAQHIRRKI